MPPNQGAGSPPWGFRALYLCVYMYIWKYKSDSHWVITKKNTRWSRTVMMNDRHYYLWRRSSWKVTLPRLPQKMTPCNSLYLSILCPEGHCLNRSRRKKKKKTLNTTTKITIFSHMHTSIRCFLNVFYESPPSSVILCGDIPAVSHRR